MAESLAKRGIVEAYLPRVFLGSPLDLEIVPCGLEVASIGTEVLPKRWVAMRPTFLSRLWGHFDSEAVEGWSTYFSNSRARNWSKSGPVGRNFAPSPGKRADQHSTIDDIYREQEGACSASLSVQLKSGSTCFQILALV